MPPPTLAAPDARTEHYGVFYGLREPASDDPVALVVGNCQAESLRVVLDGGGLATLRMPAVHELTAADLAHLDRWLARAQVLVSQPVRPDYRGLPLGTAQLAARLPTGARVVQVPVIRFAGLYPTHAIVRPPSDPSLVPPVVAYHDLGVLAAAAAARTGSPAPHPHVTPDVVLAVAAQSVEELRKREVAHGTVVVSDLFARPSFAQMRTINHPGNPVLTHVAVRVRERLGLPEHDAGPVRPLLNAVHAPRAAAVVEAFGLDEAPTEDWTVDGAVVTVAEVTDAHLRFYAEHPDAVDAGLVRHAATLRLLGLA